MKIRLSSGVYVTASLLVGAAFTTPALAADAQGGASQSGDSLQEIVVTAQRRSENVMEVPLSIAAETSEQLASSGIKDITDLQFATPGFNVSDSSGYTQVYIRGIGNSIFVGADPSVATFIDDVPRIYGSMVNNFIDVDRVEVLKGAQGGLYGRNATGGVVNIITRQPDTTAYKANARVSYGERQTFEAAAYFNAPISDKVAVSLSGERIKHNPYDDNVGRANPYSAANFPSGSFLGTPAKTAAILNSPVDIRGLEDENFYAVNGKLLVKPTDNFRITIAGDASNKNDSNGNGLTTITPAAVQATLGGFLGSFGIATNLPPGFVIGNTPKFTVSVAYPGFVRLKDSGESATAVLSLPMVDLTSITAYRYQHTQFITDLAASNVPLFAALVDNLKHYFYQELRGVSTADGPLHLIGGATYLLSQYNGKTDLNVLTPLLVGEPTVRVHDQVRNYSIYAQGEYDLTSQLSLIASGRFVHEANEAAFAPVPSAPTAESAGLTEQKFLPSVTVSYKLPIGGNAYVRWAKGFKDGGINPVASPSAFTDPYTQGGIFKGETVDTFETGIRAPLLDNKVQVSGAVFYNNYKNLQTSAHANPQHAAIILAIINAGSARTYGVEGSLDWRVARPLTLGLAAGYLNARYKTFQNADPTVLEPFNLNGTRLSNSPTSQVSFNANFDQPITQSLRLVASTLVSHTSSILWANSGLPGVLPDATDPGYWLVNARIGLRTQDDKYGIAAYANNAFDNRYTTYGSSAATTGTLLKWGNPRIVGVELTARY